MRGLKDDKIVAKPFIKWAGGKTQLLNEIELCLANSLSDSDDVCYVEPFVGGGAVLFWILQRYPNIKRAVINDINRELICCYKTIKTEVESLINELQRIEAEYLPLNHEDRTRYYLSKRKLYNSRNISDLQISALFIFLNRTCFNGLYRVNSKGLFNVPHGKYAHPKICDKQNLRAVSFLLQKVEILCGDFSKTLEYATSNSLFYFDPPYKPLTTTAAFTSYTASGFDDAEQFRLRDFCQQITGKGAKFLASNSDPSEPFFDTIYKDYTIKRVSATRMINSKADGRGLLNEILITNYK